MLTKANDAHISANVSLNSDGTFTDIQASYSPVKHLGIIGNYSSFSYQRDDINVANGEVNAYARIGELGAGYYYATDMGMEQFIFDIYGGAGTGHLQSDVNMNLHRYFVQPGIGIRTPYFEVSLNYRIAALKYSNLNINGHDSTYLADNKLIYGNSNDKSIVSNAYWFSEPAITLRGGYKFIKIQTQYVLSSAISQVPWKYGTSEMSIGISFELEDLLSAIKNSQNKRSNIE